MITVYVIINILGFLFGWGGCEGRGIIHVRCKVWREVGRRLLIFLIDRFGLASGSSAGRIDRRCLGGMWMVGGGLSSSSFRIGNGLSIFNFGSKTLSLTYCTSLEPTLYLPS